MKIRTQYKGILYIIISAFCFALMNLFVRMAGDLPSIQKSFFRNFVAAVFACVIPGAGTAPVQKRESEIHADAIRIRHIGNPV